MPEFCCSLVRQDFQGNLENFMRYFAFISCVVLGAFSGYSMLSNSNIRYSTISLTFASQFFRLYESSPCLIIS